MGLLEPKKRNLIDFLAAAAFVVVVVILLTGCAALDEMAETGEPPVRAANIYSGSVKSVMRAGLIREPWNYAAGILSAATNGGIDLTVEEPNE